MTLDLGVDWRRAREGGMLSEREGMTSTDDRSQLSCMAADVGRSIKITSRFLKSK